MANRGPEVNLNALVLFWSIITAGFFGILLARIQEISFALLTSVVPLERFVARRGVLHPRRVRIICNVQNSSETGPATVNGAGSSLLASRTDNLVPRFHASEYHSHADPVAGRERYRLRLIKPN